MINAGQLRTPARIVQIDTGTDWKLGSDRETEVWSGFAMIEPLTGYHRVNAQQEFAGATHRVTIRHNPGFQVRQGMHMVLHDGRRLHLHTAINVEERDAIIQMIATELEPTT